MAAFRPVLALPTVAVAAVAFAVLIVGRPKPVVGARLRGGPTEGAHSLSWRLEVVERDGDVERPCAGRAVEVEARFAGGGSAAWSGTLDAEGAAAVSLPRRAAAIAGPVQVHVTASGLAAGVVDQSIQVTAAAWSEGARRRGGWVHGAAATNGASLKAAPARGVFAVPFRDPLWVALDGVHLTDALVPIRATADGGTVDGAVTVSSDHVHGRFFFTPIEHAVSVAFAATLPDGTDLHLDLAPAVIPGALHASLNAGAIIVESPILRDRAYVAVVDETERILGGTVVLSPDDQGGARGTLPAPSLPEGPLWAVVSSEPDLHSGAMVGWPLRDGDGAAPATTFDVPDLLIVDSVGPAQATERARVRRIRSLAAEFAALALTLSAIVLVRVSRRASTGLQTHLSEAGADDETTNRLAGTNEGARWVVWAAVFCLGLAAVMVAVFAAMR